MAKPFQPSILDFSGGMVQGPHGSTIQANEVVNLLNLYPFAGKLIKRPGRVAVAQVAGSQVTGLFTFKTAAGTWALIAGHTTGLSKWVGAGLYVNLSTAYTASTEAWRMRQYVDVGYAARRGTGTLKRFTLTDIYDAGLVAPATGPTLTEGGAGVLAAGTYYGLFTTKNPNTGVESNPSPKSLPVTIGANKSINWAGILVGAEAQVGERVLYRTAVGQLAPFFRAHELMDNSNTTYLNENTPTNEFGPAASFKNGLPPENIELLEIFKECLWVSDGTAVYPSQLGNVESFYGLDKIQVSPDDGHRISGLLLWSLGSNIERLAIAKTGSMWYIQGNDRTDFELKNLSDKYGCIAPESLRSAEGYLIWLEGSDFYASDGGKPKNISSVKIRTILDSLPNAYKSTAVAGVYPRFGWYVCSLQTSAGGARTMVVYNYRTDAWTVFEYTPALGIAPSVLGDFYDTNANRLLYGAFGTNGYVYDLSGSYGTYLDDYVDQITCRLRTRDLGDGGRDVSLQRVAILANKNTGALALASFLNGERDSLISGGFGYRPNLSMYFDEEWKHYNLSTFAKNAPLIAVQLEHVSGDLLEISGITLEGLSQEVYGQPR